VLLVYLVAFVCLVYLVCLVNLVSSVDLVCLVRRRGNRLVDAALRHVGDFGLKLSNVRL